MKEDNIVDAAYVYWSDFISFSEHSKNQELENLPEEEKSFSSEISEEVENDDMFVPRLPICFESLQEEEYRLQSPTNPEKILIKKDSFQKILSKECLIMANILANLPENMFLVNGKVKKTKFRKIIKKQTGWSLAKVVQVENTLTMKLLEISEIE